MEILKTNKKFRFIETISFFAIIFFISSSFIQAQTTINTSNGRNSSKTAEAQKAEKRIKQVLQRSGVKFNEGLSALEDNRRDLARESFDKSVEEFLLSDINVQTNQDLRLCYNELIETIYRMEFPNGKEPVNIRRLSTICQWGINNEKADNIAKLVVPTKTQVNDSLIESVANGDSKEAIDAQIGFSDQGFEPSPLDELSKLELTEEEQDVESSPVFRQEYDVIRVAAANKSLGFQFQMHRLVQQYLNYYRGRGRRTMEVGLYRSGFFMTMARRIFREEGVPENVAWLGQVESAWKPTARSWAAAAGLWQFIPGTGKRYGLRRTAYLDERNSFEKATRASARYLKFLANRYGGNWELAMAGYNCGEGNVDKAIRRSGGVRNFWKAYPYLPRETRNYVPNILATIIIANNPQKYGFGHVRPAPRLKYDRVRIPSSTNLRLLAQASDTSVQYLRYLNPELRTNRTPPEPYVIRIPAGRANNVVAIFRRGKKVPGSRNLRKSTRGETWANISRRTGVSVMALKKANPGMKTPRGKVYVPMKANGVSATTYNRPTSIKPTLTVAGIRVVKAKTGDTVEKLAIRYKVKASDVAKLNGLFVKSKLNAGREIRIPVKSE